MSKENIQQKINLIKNETVFESITKEKVAEIFTLINDEKASRDEAVSGIKGNATQANAPTVYDPAANPQPYPNGLFETYRVVEPINNSSAWYTLADVSNKAKFPITQAMLDVNDVLLTVKNGVVSVFLNAKIADINNITNITNENTYNLDPSQIVPSEALYNDATETLAGDILKRIDKNSGVDVNYRETRVFADNTVINDSKTDGVIYKKIGIKYYVDTDFINSRVVKLSKYIPTDGEFHSISSIFPDVNLAEVQAFEPTATLANSAGWYIISKLMTWLPKTSSIDFDCDVIIDQTIILDRSYINFISSGQKIYDIDERPFRSRRVKVTQIAEKDTIKVVDGNGVFDIANYVQCVDFSDINFIGNKRFGDGISFHHVNGTSIIFSFTNCAFTQHKNGFAHYTGHINNLFFYNCEFNDNFDMGVVFMNIGVWQTNYFNFDTCYFDTNGKDFIGGEIVPYTQDLANPNWNKGAAKVYGTAISFINIAMQLNNGFGIYLNNHIQGGTFTGYAEQNILGDIVALGKEEIYLDVNSTLYSLGQNYRFRNEDVRALFISKTAFDINRREARETYSKNLLLNPANPQEDFSLGSDDSGRVIKTVTDGIAKFTIDYSPGFFILLLKVISDISTEDDIFSFSFDYKTEVGNETQITFGINNFLDTYFGGSVNVNTLGVWKRHSQILTYKNYNVLTVGLLPYFRFDGDCEIKNISVQKRERPMENNFSFDYLKPVIPQLNSTAVDIATMQTDFNNLLQKMRDSGLML